MSLFSKFSAIPLVSSFLFIVGTTSLIWMGWNLPKESIEFSHPYFLFPFKSEMSKIWLFISSLLIVWITLVVNLKLNQKHKFSEKPAFIAGYFYYLMLLAYPFTLFNIPTIISSLIILIAIRFLFEIYNQSSVKGLIFSASILVSLASLFFFPALCFLLIVFLTISIFRSFELKNFILAIVAALIPYIYLFGLAYLFEVSIQSPMSHLTELNIIDWKRNLGNHSLELFQTFGIAAMILLAYAKSFSLKQKLVVRQRHQLTILFYGNLLAIIFLFVLGIDYGLCFLIPLSGLFVYLFYQSLDKKWIFEIFFLLLFALSIFNHFFL